MIFQHTWKQALKGTKTQTRRIAKPKEYFVNKNTVYFVDKNGDDRVKWAIGKTYAVQPGRGRNAIGRIRITGIRREKLQDISENDAIAEGAFAEPTAVNCFRVMWNSFHAKPGTRWEDNPDVWVLEFDVVTE